MEVHEQDIIEQQPRKSAKIIVEGNDRRGIVEELSSTLAEKNVNVEKLITQFESASMAGYDLFKAEINVSLPNNFTMEELEAILENISDDLMVNVERC